jgi:hypothetical protein
MSLTTATRPENPGISMSINANKNKTMKLKSINHAILMGLSICAAGIMTARAQNTYITFSVDESTNIANGSLIPGEDFVYVRGTFDGWAYPGAQLYQVGDTGVYTNTIADTSAQDQSDGNVNFIYVDTANGGEHGGDYQNRMAFLPPGNNASIVLPTPYYDDYGPNSTAAVTFQVDMSEEIELGQFNPGNGDTVVVAGSFNGWSPTAGAQWVLTNNPNIRVTNNNFTPPVIESNIWTLTAAITANDDTANGGNSPTNCAQEFKYVVMPEYGWDSPSYPNQDPDSGNRFFASYSQTLPLANFNDAPYAPLANVTLNVDMSGAAFSDPNYIPNSTVVWGTFNNWANGVNMTNNPSAANPNIYSTVLSVPEGASVLYQVRYTNSAIDNFVYDFADDEVYNNNLRRTFTLPITPQVLNTNMPVFYFNDLAVNDYLPAATPVLFSVDMNGAVETNGQPFDPEFDSVYINGSFINLGYPQEFYHWSAGIFGIAAPNDPEYQMIQEGSSTIYTNTLILPAGTPVALAYQYGIDVGSATGGPAEDEAATGVNHVRVVRSTAANPYVMPTDTFTNAPYQEPYFDEVNIWGVGSTSGGNLTVGAPVAGKVPVSWLGRPGAHLQAATNVNGPWQDLPATDGTLWTSGYNSANGFVSVTNWPDTGNNFFRLMHEYTP